MKVLFFIFIAITIFNSNSAYAYDENDVEYFLKNSKKPKLLKEKLLKKLVCLEIK